MIIHHKRGIRPTLLRAAFRLLSGVYSGAVRLRLFLYRERYLHDHHLGVPVISIGNITVGGTGKTPVVELLARSLRDRGESLLVVEQNARVALQVADLAYVVEGGRIVLSGTAAELAADPRVAAAYLGAGTAPNPETP